MKPIPILIVDDHELVRRGLRAVLEAEEGLAVCGEAADGEEAVSAAARLQPRVVLMDLHMPGMGGVKACTAVREVCPDARVLVLTSYDDDDEVFEVLSAGASGYVMKDIGPDSLVQAIRAAGDGQTVLDSSIARRVVDGRPSDGRGDPELLSEREHQVLDLMAKGLGNREIGERLWITEATVKTHVTHILRKLGQSDRTQAVLAGVRLGLIDPDA